VHGLALERLDVQGIGSIKESIFEQQEIEVFRWNIDLWRPYEITAKSAHIEIADGLRRSVRLTDPDVYMLWRKPFVDLMPFDGTPLPEADQLHARVQVARWLDACVSILKSHGRIRLIEPFADRRLPKLFQLIEARAHFNVPESLFSIRSSPSNFGPRVVAKQGGN
jgi:hypothetical protein